MLNKPGYSWGADCPYHALKTTDGWVVFHARTEVIVYRAPRRPPGAAWREQDEAMQKAIALNGLRDAPIPLDAIDATP